MSPPGATYLKTNPFATDNIDLQNGFAIQATRNMTYKAIFKYAFEKLQVTLFAYFSIT